MKKYLVATDFSEESLCALKTAWSWSKQEKEETHLHLVHVDSFMPLVQNASFMAPYYEKELADYQDKWEKTVKGQFDDLVAKLPMTIKEKELIHCLHHTGTPRLILQDLLSQNRYAMAFLGAHHHSWIAHVFRESLTERLLQTSQIPMMLTKHRDVIQPRKILLPVDFSAISTKAVEWCGQWAARMKMHVDLIHVVTLNLQDLVDHQVIAPHQMQTFSIQDLIVLVEKSSKDKLKDYSSILEKNNISYKADVVVSLQEDIPAVLKRLFKQNQSDLLVIGGHRHSSLEQVFLGSVAVSMIRDGEIPLLIMK
jgi:nucleotide-binding universal stress UspA family protein